MDANARGPLKDAIGRSKPAEREKAEAELRQRRKGRKAFSMCNNCGQAIAPTCMREGRNLEERARGSERERKGARQKRQIDKF